MKKGAAKFYLPRVRNLYLPLKIDRVQKFKDFLSFALKLSLAIFFHRRSQEGRGGGGGEVVGEISESTKYP